MLQDNISLTGPKGLESFNYTVKMTLPEFKVTQEDDGKVLKCEAVIHNVPEKKSRQFTRMTSARIQVRCKCDLLIYISKRPVFVT